MSSQLKGLYLALSLRENVIPRVVKADLRHSVSRFLFMRPLSPLSHIPDSQNKALVMDMRKDLT